MMLIIGTGDNELPVSGGRVGAFKITGSLKGRIKTPNSPLHSIYIFVGLIWVRMVCYRIVHRIPNKPRCRCIGA